MKRDIMRVIKQSLTLFVLVILQTCADDRTSGNISENILGLLINTKHQALGQVQNLQKVIKDIPESTYNDLDNELNDLISTGKAEMDKLGTCTVETEETLTGIKFKGRAEFETCINASSTIGDIKDLMLNMNEFQNLIHNLTFLILSEFEVCLKLNASRKVKCAFILQNVSLKEGITNQFISFMSSSQDLSNLIGEEFQECLFDASIFLSDEIFNILKTNCGSEK